jgi:hypothetical protein
VLLVSKHRCYNLEYQRLPCQRIAKTGEAGGRHFSTGHLWQECRYRLTGGSLAFDFRLLDGNFVSIFKNLRLEDAAFGFSKHMWPLRR